MSAELPTPVRIVCISDTHNAQPDVPEGDILIHAGDMTSSGSQDELRKTVQWLSSLPHPIKLVVAGNHDRALDAKLEGYEDPQIDWSELGIIYLEHTSTEIRVHDRVFRVFGSPMTPEYGRFAFQYPQAQLLPERAQKVWETVPTDTDILITHGPPFGHLDRTQGNKLAGCPALLDSVRQLQPALHVFGHIHEGRGKENITWGIRDNLKQAWLESGKRPLSMISKLSELVRAPSKVTIFVNASIRPGHFSGLPLNEPEVVIL